MTHFDKKMNDLEYLLLCIIRNAETEKVPEAMYQRFQILDMFQDAERNTQALLMQINEFRQSKLNEVGEQINDLNHQLNNGLCTVNEYLSKMDELACTTEVLDLTGLICPITGLRYPSEEETNAFMKGFES